MFTFKGPLPPDDPLLRRGFVVMHSKPYSPGGEGPGATSDLKRLHRNSRSRSPAGRAAASGKSTCGSSARDSTWRMRARRPAYCPAPYQVGGATGWETEAREQLLGAARRREIDIVLVWRLDRWGRSVTDLLATLQELEHLGVGFAPLTEALDLTTPAVPSIC